MLYRIATVLLLLAAALPGQAATPPDWQRLAADASHRDLPIVVLVTSEGCGHCVRMHRDFLTQPAYSDLLAQRAVLGEMAREGGGKLIDFDGERVRTRVFLHRYEIFATPTLLFLDAQGRPLAPALVGFSQPAEYAQLLAGRLEQAAAVLQRDSGATRTAAVDAH